MKYKYNIIKEFEIDKMDFFFNKKPLSIHCHNCRKIDWNEAIIVYKFNQVLIEYSCRNCLSGTYSSFFSIKQILIDIDDI